jgi:hypothetical protein
MGYKTVTVDIDLDEFDDSELIDEMSQRGYTCIKEAEAGLEREDWLHLIEMLDKNGETWYTRRVRDKLMVACHG